MERELRDKWITKLRSGEYMQGRGQLKSHTGIQEFPFAYCCLGVLCEVAGLQQREIVPHVGNVEFYSRNPYEDEYGEDYEKSESELTSGMMQELGLAGSDQSILIDMNDTQQKNFSQIADWIETNL